MSRKGLHKSYFELLPSLRRFITRYFARPEDVEDVLQETFVRVDQAKTVDIRSPKSYLFRVAKNIALSELTKKSTMVTGYIEELADSNIDSCSIPLDEQVLSELRMEAFAHAVAALPAQCRRVFMLRKLHGMGPTEIAKKLQISVSTVETHLTKGLLKCSEYMEESGYGVSDLRGVGGRVRSGGG